MGIHLNTETAVNINVAGQLEKQYNTAPETTAAWYNIAYRELDFDDSEDGKR